MLELIPIHTQECKLVEEQLVFPLKRNYDEYKRALPKLPHCIIKPFGDYDCDEFPEKEDSEDVGEPGGEA